MPVKTEKIAVNFGTPSDDEKFQIHEHIVKEFIQNMDGLRSMILCGIRDGRHGGDVVEVSVGGSTDDMLRSAASIIETLVERVSKEERLTDAYKEHEDLLKGIVKVLLLISGGKSLEEVAREDFFPNERGPVN